MVGHVARKVVGEVAREMNGQVPRGSGRDAARKDVGEVVGVVVGDDSGKCPGRCRRSDTGSDRGNSPEAFRALEKERITGSDRETNQRDDETSCLGSVQGSDRGVIGEVTQMVIQEVSGRGTGKLRGESSGNCSRNLQGK